VSHVLLAFAAPAALAAILSFLLTPVARWLSRRVGAVDLPDSRKVHLGPMPRLGGLAVLASLSVVIGLASTGRLGFLLDVPQALVKGVAYGLIPVAAISFVDDLYGVRVRWKFVAHLAGAAIAVRLGIVLNPEVHFLGEPIAIGVLALPLSILWIVGVTNAFNLIDGLDGLSAGLALISAVSLAAVHAIAGQNEMAAAVLVLGGALLGFLPWNAYPAKIFLGDTGAASIGFILACVALKGGATLSAGFATVLPVLVLGLPVAETLISMARRILRRFGALQRGPSGVFDADRDHIHHRLLLLGLDHRRAVLLLYGVGASLAALGLISVLVETRQAAFLLIAFLLAAFIGVKRLGYDEFAFVRKGLILRVYDAPVVRTALFAVFFDMALVVASTYIARGLKYEQWDVHVPGPEAITQIALMLLLSVGVFLGFGLYRATWRLASLDDVARAGAAVATSAFLTWVFAPRFIGKAASASQLAIYALVATGMVCGSRISYRLFQHQAWKASQDGEPVLIYGAGQGGAAALRELRGNPAWRMRAVGFVDDDLSLRGKLVAGLPVLGTVEDMEGLLARHEARGVAIASEKIPSERIRIVRRLCTSLSLPTYRFDMRFEAETSEDGRA
jgi:UDP-GlcNAc:undecaprenyl-phosphate GlcNAc-1-phosphate transferase